MLAVSRSVVPSRGAINCVGNISDQSACAAPFHRQLPSRLFGPGNEPKKLPKKHSLRTGFHSREPTDRQSQSPLQNWIDVQLIFSLFDFSGKYAAVLIAAQCDRAHTITRYNDRPLIFEFK